MATEGILNIQDIIFKLKQLKEETSSAIAHIEQDGDHPEDCINWGDLECVEVDFCISDSGTFFYNVYIEEAAPDNHRFQLAVLYWLYNHGYAEDLINIITEW